MTVLLALAAVVLLVVALHAAIRHLVLHAAIRRLELHADRLHTAMWGTDSHGNPRPRCEACLYPDRTRPVDVQHVPGCVWHIPELPE